MKLIIKQYLASLKERSELDVVLPDLLSEMGLNVFISPTRGVKEYGVDVAAVGRLYDEVDRVYLFSVKSGNLTRSTWRGNSDQALRPSLEEIQDGFIPARVPPEHADKPIVICLCFGGDVHSGIRQDVSGYLRNNTKDNISFEEWNGDKLSDLILENLLREDLLPRDWQSMLRKSLALLDEPESSHKSFRQLVRLILEAATMDEEIPNTVIRVNLCLWILFTWCREEQNLESAYLSAEFAILQLWEKAKLCKDSKTTSAYRSLIKTYDLIAEEYISTCIVPNVEHLHAVSLAVSSPSSIDVNLKLFDILGRLSIKGIWLSEKLHQLNDAGTEQVEHEDQVKEVALKLRETVTSLKKLVKNNPVLLSPFKDSQAIDIALALYLLSRDSVNDEFTISWLEAFVNRIDFAFVTNGMYPTTLEKFQDLLNHKNKQHKDDEYREKVTKGSVLHPILAIYSSLYSLDELANSITKYVNEAISNCTLQYWYPNEQSEELMYSNSEIHGVATTNFPLARGEVLKHVADECKESAMFWELSAVKAGYLTLVLVACRYYRYPVPLNILEDWISQRVDLSSSTTHDAEIQNSMPT